MSAGTKNLDYTLAMAYRIERLVRMVPEARRKEAEQIECELADYFAKLIEDDD